jgi:hypothetical protein
VAGALAFAAYNALASSARRVGRAPMAIAAEAILVTGVIFAAAVLVDLPPATAPAAYEPAANASATVAFAAQAGEVQTAGEISPGRLGSNAYTLTVTQPGGAPVRGAQVSLRFQAKGSALAFDQPLRESGAGVYTAAGPGPNRQGAWQLLITIARPGAAVPDYAALDFEVGLDDALRLAGAAQPTALRLLAWLNVYGARLLGGLVLFAAVGWSWFAARALPSRLRPGWLVGGLLIALLVWVVALRIF